MRNKFKLFNLKTAATIQSVVRLSSEDIFSERGSTWITVQVATAVFAMKVMRVD